MPLVRQHLATSSLASVTFTGHSLGGSLATVLMLLMVIRGDLPADCVSPTYTFGAPAVFCGGASALSAPTRCAECGLNCSEAQHASQHLPATCKRPRGLFAQVSARGQHNTTCRDLAFRTIIARSLLDEAGESLSGL